MLSLWMSSIRKVWISACLYTTVISSLSFIHVHVSLEKLDAVLWSYDLHVLLDVYLFSKKIQSLNDLNGMSLIPTGTSHLFIIYSQ